jgi:ornithine cyclodeaminase
MTQIMTIGQIKKALSGINDSTLMQAMEDGFVAYSNKQVVVPPVGLLEFETPPADVHIKYGYIKNDDYYVIKIVSSFYDNPKIGLASTNGTVLVFSRKTGELHAVLLDEGYLTNVRTALAGAVVAKYLAPSHVEAIGIVGTGTQARLQLQYLAPVLSCQDVYVYGRSDAALQSYTKDMQSQGFKVTPTQDIGTLTAHCNYIVTTTPSTQPLVTAEQVRPGTHITAMGADTAGKQELDPAIIATADVVVVDSQSQCIDHGEVATAVQQKLVDPGALIELGIFIANDSHRDNDTQITVADLTGVAVQDIQIAKLVYKSVVVG